MNRAVIIGTTWNAWNSLQSACEQIGGQRVLEAALAAAVSFERTARQGKATAYRVSVAVSARLRVLHLTHTSANDVVPVPASWTQLGALARDAVLCYALGEQLQARGMVAAAFPRPHFTAISASDLLKKGPAHA